MCILFRVCFMLQHYMNSLKITPQFIHDPLTLEMTIYNCCTCMKVCKSSQLYSVYMTICICIVTQSFHLIDRMPDCLICILFDYGDLYRVHTCTPSSCMLLQLQNIQLLKVQESQTCKHINSNTRGLGFCMHDQIWQRFLIWQLNNL